MSYEEQDVIWRVALASYDPREMRCGHAISRSATRPSAARATAAAGRCWNGSSRAMWTFWCWGGQAGGHGQHQFLPRIRGLARKPLVLLRDDGRNEKSAVESLSQEDACYLIRQATLEDMLQELRAPAQPPRRRAWKNAASASIAAGA